MSAEFGSCAISCSRFAFIYDKRFVTACYDTPIDAYIPILKWNADVFHFAFEVKFSR